MSNIRSEFKNTVCSKCEVKSYCPQTLTNQSQRATPIIWSKLNSER